MLEHMGSVDLLGGKEVDSIVTILDTYDRVGKRFYMESLMAERGLKMKREVILKDEDVETLPEVSQDEWDALNDADEDLFVELLVKRLSMNDSLTQWHRRDLEMYASIVGNEWKSEGKRNFEVEEIERMVTKAMQMYISMTPPASQLK